MLLARLIMMMRDYIMSGADGRRLSLPHHQIRFHASSYLSSSARSAYGLPEGFNARVASRYYATDIAMP